MRKGNKLIQEGKVPKKRTLNTQVLTDIVNGYYLDGIEAGYKAGYEQHGKDFVENGEKAYQQGLEDGRKQGVAIDGDKRYWDGYHAAQKDEQLIRTQMYQKGLDDAWEVARKLTHPRYDGYRDDEKKEIFGIIESDLILIKMSPSEAIEKIREYEKKQKQGCETCVYNDKEWDSEPCARCTVSDSQYVYADDPIKPEKTVFPDSPCDLCRFNPPSSFDGKPCSMCPAEGKVEE